MDAGSLYFGRLLLERIHEKQAAMSAALLQGVALDYPDYKGRAGYLRALADVIAMNAIGVSPATTACTAGPPPR